MKKYLLATAIIICGMSFPASALGVTGQSFFRNDKDSKPIASYNVLKGKRTYSNGEDAEPIEGGYAMFPPEDECSCCRPKISMEFHRVRIGKNTVRLDFRQKELIVEDSRGLTLERIGFDQLYESF